MLSPFLELLQFFESFFNRDGFNFYLSQCFMVKLLTKPILLSIITIIIIIIIIIIILWYELSFWVIFFPLSIKANLAYVLSVSCRLAVVINKTQHC